MADRVRIYLLNGSSWSPPADWSDDNIVHVIGGGGGGNGGQPGGGGGGGGYANKSNLTFYKGNVLDYQVGGLNGTTWFKDISIICATGASGGSPGSGTAGDILYSGGTAGGAVGGSNSGGGGGGAAGPNGNGGA